MFLNPTKVIRLLFIVSVVTISSCAGRQASQTGTTNQPAPSSQSNSTPSTSSKEPVKPADGALPSGEATGTYTAKGETVTLKYAYAGREQRFGSESIVILLTDKPIPAEALAEELKSQTMLLDGKVRGLEYAIMKDGYWVRYHPGQYQESKSSGLKDYAVTGDVVRGSDDDKGDLTDGKYSRSVKFVAPISK